MNDIFELKNVSLVYLKKKIVKNLSYRFEKNQINAIVGPSGSGKSTLMRTLNFMNHENKEFSFSGDILFNGVNIRKMNPILLRQKASMVFQNPVVYPISIFDNIIFGVRHLRLAPKNRWQSIVEKTLKQVHLFEEVKDRLKESAVLLSQGQKQRLCFARTLAIHPEVLLLDEITASLDKAVTLEIENLIVELKEKISIILVTHNNEQVQRIADQVLDVSLF